jgi:hypothetical protein
MRLLIDVDTRGEIVNFPDLRFFEASASQNSDGKHHAVRVSFKSAHQERESIRLLIAMVEATFALRTPLVMIGKLAK